MRSWCLTRWPFSAVGDDPMTRKQLRRSIWLLGALVVGLWLLDPSTADAQCSMCRTALESSEAGRMWAASFNRAILFLLAAPFGVAVMVAVALMRRGEPVHAPLPRNTPSL